MVSPSPASSSRSHSIRLEGGHHELVATAAGQAHDMDVFFASHVGHDRANASRPDTLDPDMSSRQERGRHTQRPGRGRQASRRTRTDAQDHTALEALRPEFNLFKMAPVVLTCGAPFYDPPIAVHASFAEDGIVSLYKGLPEPDDPTPLVPAAKFSLRDNVWEDHTTGDRREIPAADKDAFVMAYIDAFRSSILSKFMHIPSGKCDTADLQERVTDFLRTSPTVCLKDFIVTDAKAKTFYVCDHSHMWVPHSHNSAVSQLSKLYNTTFRQPYGYAPACVMAFVLRNLTAFIQCGELMDKITGAHEGVFATADGFNALNGLALKPSDGVSVFVPWKWQGSHDAYARLKPDIQQYFERVFPDEEERTYMLTFFRSGIHGRRTKRFVVLHDANVSIVPGDNGKSALSAVIAAVGGPFCRCGGSVLQSSNRANGLNEHSAVLLSYKTVRIAFEDEIKGNRPFNEGKVKELVSEDGKVSGRLLQSNTVKEHRALTHFCALCNRNQFPKLSGDLAFIARIVVIRMLAKFIDPESPDVDEQQYLFPKSDIVRRLCEEPAAVFHYIMEHGRNKLEDICEPAASKLFLEEHKMRTACEAPADDGLMLGEPCLPASPGANDSAPVDVEHWLRATLVITETDVEDLQKMVNVREVKDRYKRDTNKPSPKCFDAVLARVGIRVDNTRKRKVGIGRSQNKRRCLRNAYWKHPEQDVEAEHWAPCDDQ